MNSFFLHSFNFQSIQFLIKNLTQIHDHGFVDFLPQVSSEYLDQGNFQGWDFTMHKNSRQIKLHLKTDVNICSVDGWRPPECESSVGNLVQTRSLGIGQFFVFHGFFKSRSFFPKQTFPRWEIGAFEKSMLQDTYKKIEGKKFVKSLN